MIACERRSVPFGTRCGVLLFSALLGAACGQTVDRNPSSASEQLVIGVSEGNLDSNEFGVGHFVNQVTVEALTQIASDGRALPRLARLWTWESNDRRLRLELRDDVVLHDGRRLDSQLAAEALAIAIAQPGNRARYPALRDVTAAMPDGPYTLLLDLSQRSSLLPEDLTVLLDMPAGPYRIVDRTEGAVTLEAFEKFYLGTPSIPRIVLRPFDTLRTTWASLLRGELDFVYDVPPEAVEFVRSDEINVLPVKRWYQFAIAFNSRKGPLQSPYVRRALNMAIDREALIREVLNGAGSPSSGPLWPQYWAADSSLAPYAFDPAGAVALLEAAGLTPGRSTEGAPAARLRFNCLIPENFSVLERIALHVQKNLFNIGVDVHFQVVPVGEFGKLMGSGDFDAAFLDMISGPTPGRAYIFWASARRFRGAYNIFGYENAEAERQFEILRTTRNEAAVRSATRRLQRVLLDDPPALFLAWNERARAIRHEFEFPEQPGVDPIFSLWRWTRRADTLVASVP